MKYCSRCGYQMDDDMNFCQKCGNRVGNIIAPVEEKDFEIYRKGEKKEKEQEPQEQEPQEQESKEQESQEQESQEEESQEQESQEQEPQESQEQEPQEQEPQESQEQEPQEQEPQEQESSDTCVGNLDREKKVGLVIRGQRDKPKNSVYNVVANIFLIPIIFFLIPAVLADISLISIVVFFAILRWSFKTLHKNSFPKKKIRVFSTRFEVGKIPFFMWSLFSAFVGFLVVFTITYQDTTSTRESAIDKNKIESQTVELEKKEREKNDVGKEVLDDKEMKRQISKNSDENDKILKEILGSQNLYEDAIKALKSIGIGVDKVGNFKYDREWMQGDVYTFIYDANKVEMYVIGNDRILSINIGDIKIYDENYKPLNVNDFTVSMDKSNFLYTQAKRTVKQYLKFPNKAKFPVFDSWGYGKNYNVYMVSGYVDAKNSLGGVSKLSFYLEYNKEGTFLYGTLDGKIIKGEKSQVKKIERIPIEEKNSDQLQEGMIELRYGKQGAYGKTVDGNIYYYLPEGNYEIRSFTKRAQVWVMKNGQVTNSDGYAEDIILEKIVFDEIDQVKQVTITSENRLMLTISSEVQLKKL